ncbi:phosphogluconate dehydratase [Alsobacter soli]|uniref:Phosphogluconate dehydratase n=1 Tax=Alsobacter soli TaxID=2109933 RepID=A0A2T1HRH8_9HYPH|nr:phosphogluconate dehydratase [Alsobacter soli]PSC04243.1 phosphogluconate dehydratase [Alsobacter soli]
MKEPHPALVSVTAAIEERSRETRRNFVRLRDRARPRGVARSCASCSNLAHVTAAMGPAEKVLLTGDSAPNIGVVTAYNDMLSAHQPFAGYPDMIRRAAGRAGATAQVAGGVPAMCDGITQGQPGMELSLFSRDVIALSTAVALSHGVFDAVVCLGVCDKIGPGLLIGALQFPHLPVVFSPAGPMPTGLSNEEKAKLRQLHAEGKADRAALLASEMRSYHAPGTCTFYGTANSNQVLIEAMGLHVPGAAFAQPGGELRSRLLDASVDEVAGAARAPEGRRIGDIVCAKSIVNAIVALLATGGSTNHTIHWIAVAAAAGIQLTWDDIDALSKIVPLMARIYPNGSADINAFEASGGVGFLIGQLIDAGLLHEDVHTISGFGLRRYAVEAGLEEGRLVYSPSPGTSRNRAVLRDAADPFEPESGLRVLGGNLGRAVAKTSAVKDEHRVVRAPARVFDSQEAFLSAFEAGSITADAVVVIRFQGPKANGMPELHRLMPALGSLLDRGLKVALVTDGRLSGASGKVASALHVTPEAAEGGALGRIFDGDMISLDLREGRLEAEIAPEELARRIPAVQPDPDQDVGRALFAPLRALARPADAGAGFTGMI